MESKFCALGCSSTKNLYIFPSRKFDKERRKVWLNFFDMEEPNIDLVFACERHFSHLQTPWKGTAAVPDIPITCDGVTLSFKRKPKNWRKNVIVVTPRDPEYTIYRHETGVFPQKLFNVSDSIEPAIQMPIIKSVSCSMSTQTNTRLCGLIQISDIKEEYRINCFYCNEMFAIEKWSNFVNHLSRVHFKKEEAFRMSKYPSHDHDYTYISSPPDSHVKSRIKLCPATNLLLPVPILQPVEHISLPPLLAKPQYNIQKSNQSKYEDPLSVLPHLMPKPQQSNKTTFDISLADQVIKLLSETILSPNFLHTEEDNILVIKNTGSDDIETSTFLTNIMNSRSCSTSLSQRSKSNVQSKNTTSAMSSSNTRPIYTINHGQRDVPLRRYSITRDLPKIKMSKIVRRNIAKQTLKNINDFEKIYKTIKTRYPKVVELENVHLKELNSNDVIKRRNTNLRPLSQFLKRTNTQTEPKQQKSTEIVFEYTPEDIVVLLLESMKNYPVLWKFHDKPFNKDYNKAIQELCKKINEKWSLNITMLKMRRSVIRILKFYRCMMYSESIDKFEDYFDKCALFLPSSTDEIPRLRCTYCYICYNKDSELRKHTIEQHKCLKWPYKCKQCWERFYEKDAYELHKRLPHYDEIFKCERCFKRFNRRHLYNKHVKYSHTKNLRAEEKTQSSVPEKYFWCRKCYSKFKTEGELKSHKVIHHNNEQKYKCHLCDREYTLKMSLSLHLKRHRKEFDFVCEICGKAFLRQYYLNQHMDSHTNATVTCNICGLKLRKHNLLRHLRQIHVVTAGPIEGSFMARRQKFVFRKSRKYSKEKHPRQYKCKTCQTIFANLKDLKDHNKQVHSNVKRTPCKVCNIEFIHVQNLKRHYRISHKLHDYQIFKLVNLNEDLITVMAIKSEELMAMTPMGNVHNTEDNEKKLNFSNDDYIDQAHSNKIQDEIMKAVENIDKQDIKVDDDHSMNDFFTDLFAKHS